MLFSSNFWDERFIWNLDLYIPIRTYIPLIRSHSIKYKNNNKTKYDEYVSENGKNQQGEISKSLKFFLNIFVMISSLSLTAHHALCFIWKFFAFHPSTLSLLRILTFFLVFLKSCQSCNKNVEIIFKKSTPPLTTKRKIIPKIKIK